MTKLEFENIYNRAYKFRELFNARSWCRHAFKMMVIVLGCDGLYWAVSFADGMRLEKVGYEIVNS